MILFFQNSTVERKEQKGWKKKRMLRSGMRNMRMI